MTELSRGTLICEMKNFFLFTVFLFRFFISPNLTPKSIMEPEKHFNLLAQVFSFSFHQHHLRFFLNYKTTSSDNKTSISILDCYLITSGFVVFLSSPWHGLFGCWLSTRSGVLMWPQRANESCGLGSEVESVVQHNEIFFTHFRVDKSSDYSYESLDCSMRQLKI